MKRLISFALLPAVLCSSPLLAAKGGKSSTGGSGTGVVQVNCSAGESLQAILDKNQGTPGVFTIEASGTCNESLVLGLAKVVIKGTPSVTIAGNGNEAIRVTDFSYLNLQNATVRPYGSSSVTRGIAVWSGRLHTTNVKVTGMSEAGIHIGTGARGWLQSTEISGNNNHGLYVDRNSEADVYDVILNSNRGHNIVAERNSSIRVEGGTVSGGANGIVVSMGSSGVLRNLDISGASGLGVVVTGNSIAEMRNLSLSSIGNDAIRIIDNSTLQQWDDADGLRVSGAKIGLRVNNNSVADIRNLSVSGSSDVDVLVKGNSYLNSDGPSPVMNVTTVKAVIGSTMYLNNANLSGAFLICADGSAAYAVTDSSAVNQGCY